jgi:hypothetical protein
VEARVSAVISSPDLGVFAVTAESVLCAFAWAVDALPDTVSSAELARAPSSVIFLEQIDYYVNAVRLHVTAADALVGRGVDKTTSDNRRHVRPRHPAPPGAGPRHPAFPRDGLPDHRRGAGGGAGLAVPPAGAGLRGGVPGRDRGQGPRQPGRAEQARLHRDRRRRGRGEARPGHLAGQDRA